MEGGEVSKNAGWGEQPIKYTPVVNQKPRLMSACCKYFPFHLGDLFNHTS